MWRRCLSSSFAAKKLSRVCRAIPFLHMNSISSKKYKDGISIKSEKERRWMNHWLTLVNFWFLLARADMEVNKSSTMRVSSKLRRFGEDSSHPPRFIFVISIRAVPSVAGVTTRQRPQCASLYSYRPSLYALPSSSVFYHLFWLG